MPLQSIVVVGASLAGLRSAEALRRRGFAGRLCLVGAETQLPYDRPPLSKEVLAGKREPEQIALSKPGALEALGLELRLGARAVSLDPAARRVALAGGEELAFDALVIATGSTPRALRGAPPLEGVHTLRTLGDCLAIRAALERGPRVAVVGAGFIGAEVASVCRGRGLDVVMLEALAQPMANALGAELGAVLAAVHRDHGVDLRCGVGVAGLEGRDRVEAVRLADGSRVEADLVVVGIGAFPETRWLEGSGLELSDGVVCDESLAAGPPGVVAAGDVARWRNPLFGESMRVEHWTNAVEQGEAAAARLLAEAAGERPAPFAAVPYVWSDQYDRKIMAAGITPPDAELRVCHGSLAERRFVALFGRRGRLVGALAFNRARELTRYRRMLREAVSWDEALAHAAAHA